jgi:hypothetical protein
LKRITSRINRDQLGVEPYTPKQLSMVDPTLF